MGRHSASRGTLRGHRVLHFLMRYLCYPFFRALNRALNNLDPKIKLVCYWFGGSPGRLPPSRLPSLPFLCSRYYLLLLYFLFNSWVPGPNIYQKGCERFVSIGTAGGSWLHPPGPCGPLQTPAFPLLPRFGGGVGGSGVKRRLAVPPLIYTGYFLTYIIVKTASEIFF